MNVIWKFPLSDEETIIEAHVVNFLTVQIQEGTPCVWAVVDPERAPKKYKVTIFGQKPCLSDNKMKKNLQNKTKMHKNL